MSIVVKPATISYFRPVSADDAVGEYGASIAFIVCLVVKPATRLIRAVTADNAVGEYWVGINIYTHIACIQSFICIVVNPAAIRRSAVTADGAVDECGIGCCDTCLVVYTATGFSAVVPDDAVSYLGTSVLI